MMMQASKRAGKHPYDSGDDDASKQAQASTNITEVMMMQASNAGKDSHDESDAPTAAQTKQLLETRKRKIYKHKNHHASRCNHRMPDHRRQVFTVTAPGESPKQGLHGHDERVVDDGVQES